MSTVLDLPTVREEYTMLALQYNFVPTETGLYGVLVVDNELPEYKQTAAFYEFVEWIEYTIDNYPDLVTYHSEGNSIALYIARVFVCVFSPPSEPDDDRKEIIARINRLETKIRRTATRLPDERSI